MELNKRKKSSKVVKVDSFYARIAEKGKRMREAEEEEDITIEEWIDYIKRFKEDERRREEERL
jgi:hypothetical protein